LRDVSMMNKAFLKLWKKLASLIDRMLSRLVQRRRWVSFGTLSVSIVGLIAVFNFAAQPGRTAAGSNTTGIGELGPTHKAVDWVVIDPVKEAQLNTKVKQERIGNIERSRFATGPNSRAAAASPDVVGKWSAVYDWPVVAIHATLLPGGKVLAYDSVPGLGGATEDTPGVHTGTRVTLWTPDGDRAGSHVSASNNLKLNLFCSGHTTLADGRLFAAGGNLNSRLEGFKQTHVFNPSNNTWNVEGNMQVARWYPSVTTTEKGEVLITGGLSDPAQNVAPTDKPEVRAVNGSLRVLNGAASQTASNRFYGWLRQAPNGKVAYLGPEPNLRYLDVNGNGSWSNIGNRDGISRGYGSFAMYEPGKVLISGGSTFNSSAVVVDLNTNTSRATSPMAFQRRQHNLTILADGQVLATGGYENSGNFLIDINKGVYPAEVWNPGTGQWKTLASMERTRQYHSIALLLPNGRVLSAGGGICGDCRDQNYLQKNAEIFSPPYLFKKDGSGQLADRPVISAAPGTLGYNQRFTVTTASARRLTKVSLVRFGGVTHSVNMDQQYLSLPFTPTSNSTISVTSPNNSRIAPPGRYMMFLIDDQGVPSFAKFMQVS
jgi:N-acetylneuraminic acid mutarotase